MVTYTADTISLGSGVVVNLTVAMRYPCVPATMVPSTLGTTINVNGGNDPSNVGGSGKAGGFDGGAMDVDGNGPVKGKTKSVNMPRVAVLPLADKAKTWTFHILKPMPHPNWPTI